MNLRSVFPGIIANNTTSALLSLTRSGCASMREVNQQQASSEKPDSERDEVKEKCFICNYKQNANSNETSFVDGKNSCDFLERGIRTVLCSLCSVWTSGCISLGPQLALHKTLKITSSATLLGDFIVA